VTSLRLSLTTCRTLRGILSLDVDVIVPGHGPIADKTAVCELRSYFEFITAQARMHFDNGLPYEEAARKISLDRFALPAGPSIYRHISPVSLNLESGRGDLTC
jgi:hypothetical protein